MENFKSTLFNKIKRAIIENKRWIILSVLIAVFAILAETAIGKEKFIFDSVIYKFLVLNRTELLNLLFKCITQFGSAPFLILTKVLCIIFVKNKKYKITIPVNLAVITIINVLLKNIFARPRPNQFRIIEETGFSFPSGHSMVSMAFYGYFIYLIYKKVKNKAVRNTICIVLSILILLIGISRVYLGVHYASDVIAGICFSIAYLIFMISAEIYK